MSRTQKVAEEGILCGLAQGEVGGVGIVVETGVAIRWLSS